MFSYYKWRAENQSNKIMDWIGCLNQSECDFCNGEPTQEKVKTSAYVEILDGSEKTKHICPGSNIMLMPLMEHHSRYV